MSLNIQLDFLENHRDKIPQIAKWLHDEWGYLRPNSSANKLTAQLAQRVNLVKPPIHIIALKEDQAIGTVALKPTEMVQFPEREYWLGSLFVDPAHRGKGIATMLEAKVINVAKSLSIPTLYLQTEALEGGLYTHLGWEKLEVISYDGITVQVMKKSV